MAYYLQTDAYSLPLEEVKLARMTIAAADATVADTDRILTATAATGPCTATLVAASNPADTLTIAFVATQADDPVGVITFKLEANGEDTLAVSASDTTGIINIKLAKTDATKNTASLIRAAIRAVTPDGGVQGTVKGIDVSAVECTAGGSWDTAAKAPGANMSSVACVGGGGQTILAADLTAQPSCPRNITATAGGTENDIGAVSVIVYGTNIDDQPISETLTAFTVNNPGTKAGTKAFKTVTSVFLPSHDGTGATVAIGTGEVLGLPFMFTKKPLCLATLNGAFETTFPAIVVDPDEIENNTVDLSTTLNSTEVCVYLGIPEA